MSEIVLKGIPAAPGIAKGPAFILDKQDFIVTPRSILDEEVNVEIARFEEALQKTKQEISDIQQRIEQDLGIEHSQIFDAHKLVLEDKTLIKEVIKRIQSEKLSAEYVYSDVLKKYVKIFSRMEDEYLRERVSDVGDVGRRVLKNLMNETKLHEFENLEGNLIIVSHDLAPSDTANMFNKNILAFCTDIGGKTSHSAIMAKSLGIPAVVGLKDATLRIQNSDTIIVDGRKGLVIINPAKSTLEEYEDAKDRIMAFADQFDGLSDAARDVLEIVVRRRVLMVAAGILRVSVKCVVREQSTVDVDPPRR